uniref:(northern house mosquito) hypothetical protein n=1 Tax=Culex pipiens TaxID=7175 RepID=A0A8D8CA86_CULPI
MTRRLLAGRLLRTDPRVQSGASSVRRGSMRVRSATTCGGSSRAPGARGEARGSWLCRTVCFQRLDIVGWVAYHEGFDAFCPGSERAASPIDDRRVLRSRRLDSQEP